MRRNNFLTNAMIPGALGMHQWDAQGRSIKDIVLSNPYATQFGVSEMKLNVSKFSAIDEHGKEHFVADFPGQRSLRLCGIPTGKNIRSRSIVNLKPGNYTRLKFYLEEGGSFVFRDRREMPLSDYNSIEFEIEGGLEIKGNESPGFILRFDFPPFKAPDVMMPLIKAFRYLSGLRSKFTRRVFSN